MASLEEYDEFGNYIGADLDSDDEDEAPQNDFSRSAHEQPQAAPLEGFDDEESMHVQEGALMEIDGSGSNILVR
jgi:116 kDa U5 small nuclear ribonucleoprotein component